VSSDGAQERARRAHELYVAGRCKEAAVLLIETIKADPTEVGPYKLLADVERALGNRSAERAVLEEWLVLEPLDAAAWRRLASVHAEQGRVDDAHRCYRHAARLAPEDHLNWEGLASAGLSAQRLHSAQEATAQLLQRFPTRATSDLLAGHVKKALGQFEEARADYEAALHLDPACSEALYNLVDLEPPTPADPLAVRIRQLLESGGISDVDAVNLGFALGRIHEAAKEYAQAFEHYERANAAASRLMRAQGIAYSPSACEEWVATTIARYSASVLERTLAPLPLDLQMIFIVGMPRSGTSLAEQILASHPEVTALGELSIAGECESLFLRRRTQVGLTGPIDAGEARERDLLEEVRECYLDRLFERELATACVIDKQPGNFSRLGFLRLLFPDALFIHTRRDPVATCMSLFASNFTLHSPYYNSLGHMAHYYRCYQQLMAHWHSLMGPQLESLQYEALVRDPRAAVERLLCMARLPWDERCMRFHETRRPVLTASHRQVRQPIYTTSVERWRPFAAHLGELASIAGGSLS
jgi:tetratricopeptide (TPR) repeat protein